MKWLSWKDYRHNRLIVIAGLVILLGPYLIGFGILCGASWIQTGTQDGQPVYWTPEWRDILGGACAYSLILSQVTLALIGGNAISGERVDRSAEFLYSMPVTRRKLLASKLTLALIVTAVIWLTSAVVFVFVIPPHEWAALRRVGELPRLNWVAVMSVGTVPITGITFFCIAWFLSSYVASPAFDVCGGFLAPVLVISGIGAVDTVSILSGLSEQHIKGYTITLWYEGICLALAAVCFGLGTWHYLRRLEP